MNTEGLDQFGIPFLEAAKKAPVKKAPVKKATAKKTVGNLTVPKGVTVDVSGGLANVTNWKALVVLGNSVGREGAEVGEMGDVGYIMINPSTKEIIPIARSDEHHTGWDLLRHFHGKGIIKDLKGFYPIYCHGHTYIWDTVEEALPAFKLWRENGGPNVAAETYPRSSAEQARAADIDNWIAGDQGEMFKEGVIPPVGKKLIKTLEAAALETKKVLAGRGDEEKVYQYARDIVHTLKSFFQYERFPKDADKQIDQFEAKHDFQSLQELLFGMDGIKNNLHQWIREYLPAKAQKGYGFGRDFQRFFGDPKVAMKEFDRLGQI